MDESVQVTASVLVRTAVFIFVLHTGLIMRAMVGVARFRS